MTNIENIKLIANELGIDEKNIMETKTEEEIVYQIFGDKNKKLEISKQLTAELLQNFHLEFRHCIFKKNDNVRFQV